MRLFETELLMHVSTPETLPHYSKISKLSNFAIPAHCHDAPDVHAGHLTHDRASPADAPNKLGARVDRFGAFGLVGQIAYLTLWDGATCPGAPSAPRRAVLGSKVELGLYEQASTRARRARRGPRGRLPSTLLVVSHMQVALRGSMWTQ